jgi:hypothetical protein
MRRHRVWSCFSGTGLRNAGRCGEIRTIPGFRGAIRQIFQGAYEGGGSIYRIVGDATGGGDFAVVESEASADGDRELKPKASHAA